MGQATPRNRRTAGNSDEILSGRIRCPLPGVTPFFAMLPHNLLADAEVETEATTDKYHDGDRDEDRGKH